MAVREWLRPPRNLLVAFAGITLVLGTALGLLGWRLVGQDRDAGAQRIQDRLERAADRTATELLRRLVETQRALSALAVSGDTALAARPVSSADLDPDGLVVVITRDGIVARPDNRLLYHPVTPPSPVPDPELFRAGETAEFRQRNPARAVAEYRRLARSGQPSVRAGALLRLGRVLRQSGRADEALRVYADLAAVDATPVEGLPAALLAGYARCSIMEALGRGDSLRAEAARLEHDLLSARWRLSRSTWAYYTGEVSRWTGTALDSGTLALATAVDSLWVRFRGRAEPPPRRVTIASSDPPVLSVWGGGANRTAALLAGSGYIARAWLGPLHAWLDGQNAAVTLVDAEGRTVVGAADVTGPQALRTAADVELPWTVRVTLADPAREAAAAAARQRQLIVVLLIVTAVFVLGMYFIGRAVTREIAVARLQADFVAAVSHEFRTPLTSMRQLTELLASGRVPDEARRVEYYRLMARESERLHRLVENLLDFGRMEAGAQEFRPEITDVGELVHDIVADFRAERGADAEVVRATVDGGGVARVDRDALSRAVWNLLDNALKYSPPGTEVAVSVHRLNGRVHIDVRDHGIGIPPDEHHGIFERFVRGAAAKQAGVKGTGIGLAMVRHIVEAHDGVLSLRSAPERGSTFTISLPTEA